MRARSRLTLVTGQLGRSHPALTRPSPPRGESVPADPLTGASQRVLYFATPGHEVAVALSDLASSPKLVVEMAIDRDDLERRLARPGLNGLAASAVVVAGEYAVDTTIEAAPLMLARYPEIVVVAYCDLRENDFDLPSHPRLVMIDIGAPPIERRRALSHALGRNAPAVVAPEPSSKAIVGAVTGALRRPTTGPVQTSVEHDEAPSQALARPHSRDPLTGLADRAALHQRLESEIARLRGDPGYQFALLILNINRFKVINDSFGHGQADALLIDVGQRLTDAVRQSDLVARMGADEFAIVLGQSQGHLNAQIVAQRLFRGPVTLTSGDGRSLTVTAAVGGVVATGGATHTVADLYRKASLALASIKDKGGTRVAFFHPESHARDLFQLDLEPQIMRGIRDQEFSLHHQPLVSLKSGRAGRIEGVEALIRWQHPTLGMVSPGAFVPMLESSGLIEPLGRWIVSRACADLLRLQDSPGGADVFLNLNVSHRQLLAPDFAQLVANEVRTSGVDPSKLGIELTETTMIDDFEVVTANIDALRKTGIKIFVDDFGVGYSSLSSLSRLPVDVLKIDRSFIREMTVHPRSAALVAKIVEIGHIFDLPIVAEGIETTAELDAVRAVGCDYAQGFHLARPAPLEEVRQLIAQTSTYPRTA